MPSDDVNAEIIREVENGFHALDFFHISNGVCEPTELTANSGDGQMVRFNCSALLQKFIARHRIRTKKAQLKTVCAEFNSAVKALIKIKPETLQHDADGKMLHTAPYSEHPYSPMLRRYLRLCSAAPHASP